MIWLRLIEAELALATLAALAFVTLYLWRSNWDESPVGRHMVAFAIVGAIESGLLLLAALRVSVPLWLFVVTFALMDVVFAQRLWLLWRAQHNDGALPLEGGSGDGESDST